MSTSSSGPGSAQSRVPPESVRRAARLALRLKKAGYAGGTETGFARARQLATTPRIPLHDMIVMRAWFARHGPAASNGGTSYPGYVRWIRASSPERTRGMKSKWRGAVAWLLWGGDPAYRWIRSYFRLQREWPAI